jgi:hypothetical protein
LPVKNEEDIMTELTNQPNPTPPAAPVTPPPATPDAAPGPVPYDRFKEINDQLKATKDALAKIEAERQAADEKRLTDEKKWQELAEKREAELKAERARLLRLQVASKKNLPFELADRLRGDTEADMEKDADSLAALLKPAEPPKGPGVPPKGAGGQPTKFDFNTMTPEEIRKNSAAILAAQ